MNMRRKNATAAWTVELEKVAKDLIYPLFANENLDTADWERRLGELGLA